MKTLSQFAFAAAALTGLAQPCFAAGFFSSDDPVSKVHAAYVAGDFKKMVVEMKHALESAPNDALVRDNVLSTLTKAYELRGSQGVPADWSLPAEITKMRVSVRLRQREIPAYSLKVYGTTQSLGIIKQLKVTRFPDQVVLDKENGIGEWDEAPGKNGEPPEYGFDGLESRQPIPAGLYLIHIQLTNGKNVDGWFLIESELNATSTPEIAVPAFGETFHTGTPTFKWADFRSPEYQPNERRSLWMGVSRSEPPKYDWDEKWSLYLDAPTLTEATIGSTLNGIGATELESGRYIFVLKYSERRRFGDITIGRDCVNQRPFVIQR